MKLLEKNKNNIMKFGDYLQKFFEEVDSNFRAINLEVVDLNGDKTTAQEKLISERDFRSWLKRKIKPSEYLDDDTDKGILIQIKFVYNDIQFDVSCVSKDLERLKVNNFKAGKDEINSEKYRAISDSDRLADAIIDIAIQYSKEQQ